MNKKSLSYIDLQREAEHQFIMGNFARAYDIYNDMKERVFCQEQTNECERMMKLCLSEPEQENRFRKLLNKIMSSGLFLILTMFFLTSFGKYDNTCFGLVYESDSVKIYHSSGISKDYQNSIDFNKKKVDFIEAYNKWEPYMNKTVKPKTKPLYNIDF